MSSRADIRLVYRAKFQLSAVVLLVTITVAIARASSDQRCDPLCVNGQCLEKRCQCLHCWSGPACDQLVDEHRPTFPTKRSKVYLSREHLTAEKSIFAVKAFDQDTRLCAANKPCKCGDIAYKLSAGNQLFDLNGTSGEIFLKAPEKMLVDSEYGLSVQALPRHSLAKDESTFDEFHLIVLVQEALGRVKRQAQKKKGKSGEAVAKNVEAFPTSFSLRTVGGEVNSLQVGSSIHYRLEIALPRATVDLILEIYTKDSHTGNKSQPALSLYNFTIPSRVSGISFSTPEQKFFLSNKSHNVFDKLLIDFGSIKNTGPDRNVLTIYFSVVLTRKPGKAETKHSVMIGAEYGKGTLVWVAQSQITTTGLSQFEDQVHSSVDFETPPTKVALDSAVLFQMNANLEFRSDNLRVEVSRPSFEYEPDNLISIGRISVNKFAKNYQAIPNNASHYVSERETTISPLSFSKSVLSMGTVTNIGEKSRAFTNNSDNILTFAFPIYALNFNENVNRNATFNVRITLGSKTVWSRVANISIVERKAERSTAKMLSSIGLFTAYNVSKGGLTQLLVRSDFAETDGFVDFALQVEVPMAQRAPLLVPCAARFVNKESGFNVPYLNAMLIKPSEDANQFTFNLGRIHFLTQRSSLSTDNNVVVAEITFRVPFHREIEEGTTLNANVKVFSGSKSNKVAIAQNEVSVFAENKTNEIEVSTNRSVLWEDLVINGGIAYNFAIQLAPNTAYREFRITVHKDNQLGLNFPDLNICKISLAKVDMNLPCTCVQTDRINMNHTEYHSLSNSSIHDKASIDLGSISVINSDSENSRGSLLANVALMIRDNIEEHPFYPIKVAIEGDGEILWSEQINFTIADSTSLSDSIRNMAPKLNLKLVDEGTISPGFTTNVILQVTIAPNTIGPLAVEVISDDDELSVCGLWIDHIGENMPCINKEEKANYESVVYGQHNMAQMHFDSITNFGSSARRSAAEEKRANTLEFVAMVRVSETAKTNKTIKVLLTHGHRNEKFDQELVIPVNGTDTKMSEFIKPKQFSMKSADESNVTYGGIAKLIHFDIELEKNSQVPITILMESSADYKICSAAFVKIGKNYPCYSPSSLKVSPGKFELGTPCHTYLNKDSSSDNLLTLAVALRPGGSSLPDRSFKVSALAYIGPTPLNSKSELLMSVASNYTGDNQVTKGATVHAETGDSDSRTTIKIRERKWVPFNVRIPPFTTGQLTIHLQGEADQSRAIVSTHDLRIVSGGANIPCPLENRNFKLNFNSSVPTSQTNIIVANLGYFSNFGFSHMLTKNGNESDKLHDDFLKFEMLVELADHPSIVEESTYQIIIYTHYGSPSNPIIRQGQVKLTPALEGETTPKIDVNIKIKKKMEPLDRGDTFMMTATLRHLPESLAEPINPILRLFSADFIEVIRVDSANIKELPILLNSTTGDSADILFPWILFSDEIVVNFTIQIDPKNIRGYGRPEDSLITPYRVLCEHFRTDSNSKSPCSQLKHLHFLTKSSECNGPLGMESGVIDDTRISASTSISEEYAPKNARPNSGKFWSPVIRNGRKEYLQLDFGRKTRVVSLSFKSIRGLRRVATFHLLYSNDGNVWRTAANRSHITYHGETGDSIVKHPEEARFYRIVLEEIEASNKGKQQYVAVRFELYGCYLGTQASNETSSAWPTHFSDDPTAVNRHIAADVYTNVIYFCDSTLDGHQLCYYSGNGGQSWNIIGRSIDSVEGFELATGKFFAIDYQRPAYFSSSNGFIWTPVDYEQFNSTVNHSKFHRKIMVPQLHREDIRKLDIKMGNWRANYDGLYYEDGANARAYWKNCCGLD